jgi:hypothetical protein
MIPIQTLIDFSVSRARFMHSEPQFKFIPLYFKHINKELRIMM